MFWEITKQTWGWTIKQVWSWSCTWR